MTLLGIRCFGYTLITDSSVLKIMEFQMLLTTIKVQVNSCCSTARITTKNEQILRRKDLHVRLSVYIGRLTLDGVPWNIILRCFMKICRLTPNFAGIGQIFREFYMRKLYCCWRHKFVIKALLCNTQDFYIVDNDI